MTKLSTVTRKLKCIHSRRKDRCKLCGGSGICEHGLRKDRCKECRRSSLCSHGLVKSQCKDCKECIPCSGRKRKISDITDENIANVSANEGRNFKIV